MTAEELSYRQRALQTFARWKTASSLLVRELLSAPTSCRKRRKGNLPSVV